MVKGVRMDRNQVHLFQADIRSAVEEIAKKHGMALTKNSARYSDFQVGITLQFETTNKEGQVEGARKEWDLYCGMFGFSKTDFGREFTTRLGKTYRITGIKPGRPKYPILATDVVSGVPYKFDVFTVKMFLGKDASVNIQPVKFDLG